MKTTLNLTVLLCVVMTSTQALAEARAPQLVITEFVEALQKNDLEYLRKYVDLDKVKNQPKRGYTVEALSKLFADVQIKQIELSKPLYDKKTKIIRIRMNKPLSFDFELQHQSAVKGKGDFKDGDFYRIKDGDFYRIIGIHP